MNPELAILAGLSSQETPGISLSLPLPSRRPGLAVSMHATLSDFHLGNGDPNPGLLQDEARAQLVVCSCSIHKALGSMPRTP